MTGSLSSVHETIIASSAVLTVLDTLPVVTGRRSSATVPTAVHAPSALNTWMSSACAAPFCDRSRLGILTDGMNVLSATMYLVYPFRHHLEDRDVARFEPSPSSGWAHWFTRLSVTDFAIAVDHSYSFIPPVKAVLNPEMFGREREQLVAQGVPAAAGVTEVRRAMAASSAAGDWREAYKHRAVRLTWNAPSLWIRQPLVLEIDLRNTLRRFTFQVRWADALMMPGHIGAVVLRVDLEAADLEDIASVTRHIKKIVYRRRLTVGVPSIRRPDGSVTSWAKILESLLKDLTMDRGPVSVLSELEWAGSRRVNWRLAVIVRADPRSSLQCFTSGLEEAAFCISVGRGPKELENLPAPSDLQRLRARSELQLWESWLAIYNYDNLVFAVDAHDRRLEQEFLNHCENFEYEYLTMFILAIVQRSILDLIASDLASVPGDLRRAIDQLDSIEGKLIRFNTRLWFDQVSTTPVGAPLYELLADRMGLAHQHEQVFLDVERLRNHLSARATKNHSIVARRTETLLQFLSIVAVPLGLYLALFQQKLAQWTPLQRLSARQIWIGMGAATLFLVTAWWSLRRKNKATQDDF
ncbi:hypothetical protein [Micromonospora sp. bgisy143]|uniref:hypothetical protein n=1 Tax=Micromonospora sp. bgisy143 TaxID=3413790 RepID=UPI003EBDC0BF